MARSYEEGLRDGAIQALESSMGEHKERLDAHELRLGRVERFMYIGIGALMLLEFGPAVKQFFG